MCEDEKFRPRLALFSIIEDQLVLEDLVLTDKME